MTYFQNFIAFAQHHSIIFVLIVTTSFFAIFIFTILLLNPKKHVSHQERVDIQAIAGDDIFVTQLDLARAYIELGNTNLAKDILQQVSQQGNHHQKQAAQELLSTI